MHYKVWNIYFVQMIGSDWIKIGKTSKQKSEEIITSLKLPVNVIKIVLGTGELLKTLKAEFESHCVKDYDGWYHPVPELLTRIDSIEDYDGGDPPPPPPTPKKRPREEYVDPYYYCSRCSGQFETDGHLMKLEKKYIDWGDIDDYMGWDRDTGYICQGCLSTGGLANIIFEAFYSNRKSLSPYWLKSDEEFLEKCVDSDEIDESSRYVWLKAQIFTREMHSKFILKNPSGNINKLKNFIYGHIDELVKTNFD